MTQADRPGASAPGHFGTDLNKDSDAKAFYETLHRSWESVSIRVLETEDDQDLQKLTLSNVDDSARVVVAVFDGITEVFGETARPTRTPVVVTFIGQDGRTKWAFNFRPDENHWTAGFEFPDGSSGQAWPREDPLADTSPEDSLDSGVHLLEPISQEEYDKVETMLGLLTDLAHSDELDEDQSRRVLDLIIDLRRERTSIQPNETQRWKVVGALRWVGRVLSGIPMKLYWTTKLITLINEMGWPRLAAEYQEFFKGLADGIP